MDPHRKSEIYSKAKFEAPLGRLPKALLKFNTDQSSGELCYVRIFEDDVQKHKHIAEEMAAGAKLDRKVYRIRNMELLKALGKEFKGLHQIHKVSKASIGFLADSESDSHDHAFLDIMGTEAQVKMAEELILDKILATYELPVFPIILMPPTIFGHELKLHMDKVESLIGENGQNMLAMEVVSGAWMQVDNNEAPSGSPKYERTICIYGPKAHVYKAVALIYSQAFAPGECDEAEEEMTKLFKQISFDEMMEGMKPRTPQMFEILGAAFMSDSGSSSASGLGSGPGQIEMQKEKHVEDKVDPKGKKKQQDVEALD